MVNQGVAVSPHSKKVPGFEPQLSQESLPWSLHVFFYSLIVLFLVLGTVFTFTSTLHYFGFFPYLQRMMGVYLLLYWLIHLI